MCRVPVNREEETLVHWHHRRGNEASLGAAVTMPTTGGLFTSLPWRSWWLA